MNTPVTHPFISPRPKLPPNPRPLGRRMIEKNIQEGDYGEAIKELLSRLQAPENFDFEKTFEYLFTLFPHLNNANFGNLLKCLKGIEKGKPSFLDLTANYPEHQYQLSLLLGEELHKQQASLQAMDCFAKAIKIGEIRKDEKSQKEAHFKASKLLLDCIKNRFLTVDSFKQKLQIARGTAKVAEFSKHLEGVNKLRKFCPRLEGSNYIDELFKQARDVLNEKGALGNFNPFIGMIAAERDKPVPPVKTFITEKYNYGLSKYRSVFNDIINIQDVRGFQSKVTEELRNFFAMFLEDAFLVLGEPPCDYDFRAIGSIGREEPCLFSDLEFFILIQSEEHRAYFTTLIEFLELQVMSLGETAGTEIVFTCLGNKNSSGFHFDSGGNPRLKPELMNTPEKLAALHLDLPQTSPLDLPSVSSNQILKSISLLKEANNSLYSEYQKSKNIILDKGEKKKLRQERALQLFQTRMVFFKEAWPASELPNPIHLKNHFVQFINFLLADLALYWGVEATNTLDIIDELTQKKVFTAKTHKILREAVSTIYRLRLRLHQYYGEQIEEGYLTGTNIAGCNLTGSEKAELEKIYSLVLYPLYHRVLEFILVKGEFVGRFFERLDLIDTCLDAIYTCQKEPDLALFRSITAYLMNTQEPFLTHLNIFKELSKRSYLESVRQTHLEMLEKGHLSETELEQIRAIPNREGMRPSFLRRVQQLQDRLEAISISTPHDGKKTIQVKVISLRGERFLKPEVILEIFDKTGGFKNGYPGSAHRVTSTRELHFKQKPTHPLMEYAIHNLCFRIAGEMTPATELIRFEVEKRAFPVLISTTVQGTTLKTRLPNKLENTQWARWTWMLLCSILTRPGDGRLSNYVLDLKDNIFCVDNDISFVEPFLKKGLVPQVNFCCVLFCLFEKITLDRTVLEEFCSLDVDAILMGWIDDVIKKETEYLSLFSESERALLYTEDPNNNFKATILFKEGTLATLNTQFVYLQNQVHTSLAKNEIPTAEELLKYIITLNDNPTLSNAPGVNIERSYFKAKHTLIEDRLKQITSRHQDQTLTSLKSDQACLGRNPTHEEIEKKQLFSPAKAKEELMANLLHRSADFISIGTVKGKETLRVSFKELVMDGIPDIERQRLVLRSLLSLLGLQPKKPIFITLQHCAVLETKSLDSLLHEELAYLDLRYCEKIGAGDIELISKKCPYLKELYLSGCHGLTAIRERTGLSSGPLVFTKLEILHTDRCTNLKNVQLSSQNLKYLTCDKNPKLNQLIIKGSLLLVSTFKECPILDPDKIEIKKTTPLDFIKNGWNKEFMLAAVSEDANNFIYASDEFKQDRDIVLAVIKQNSDTIQFAYREVVTYEFNQVEKEKQPRSKNNWEIGLVALPQNSHPIELSNKLMQDLEIVNAMVSRKESNLPNDTWKHLFRITVLANDKNIIIAALKSGRINALEYASDELKNDREILLVAVTKNGLALEYASKELKNDREIVLAAVKQDCWGPPFALQYASDELKNDREIVLAAVNQNGLALKYASNELKNDREIVLVSVTKDGWALAYASNELKNDLEIVLTALKQKGSILKYASDELRNDREIVLATVKKDDRALKFASDELKNDREIVLAAVMQNGQALEFASDELKNDREIVLNALKQNGLALKYANDKFKNARVIVIAAVMQDGEALTYASDELRDDRLIVLAAVKQQGFEYCK